jgi:hypothetical protein
LVMDKKKNGGTGITHMMQDSTRDLLAALNNPNLDTGIMQPILSTDDNDTPDSMATTTPSFLAAVDELLAAGYRSTTGNLLNWSNGDTRATIEICTSTGAYGAVYYPASLDDAPTSDKAEALYAYLQGVEYKLNRFDTRISAVMRAMPSIDRDICTLQRDAHATAVTLKAHASQLALMLDLTFKIKRAKRYAELSIATCGGISMLAFLVAFFK